MTSIDPNRNQSELKIENLIIEGDLRDEYLKSQTVDIVIDTFKEFIKLKIEEIENYSITTQENEHIYIDQINILQQARSILFNEK